MKLKNHVAKAIATVSTKIAKSAGGAASTLGTYQPKEPAAVSKMKK